MSAASPHTRLRYVHELAGAFVLVTLLALFFIFGLAGRAQQWLAPVERLRVLLPREGSFGLREGADVQLLGTVVGSVDRLTISMDEIAAVIVLRREFVDFVRKDSRAVIRRTFGVAGDAYLEITRGSGERIDAQFTLAAQADQAPTETLQLVIDQIRNEAIPAVQAIRKAAEEYTQLAVDLQDPNRPLQQFIAGAGDIAGKISRGDGLVGRLIADPEFADDTEKLVKRATVSIDSLIDLLGDVRVAAASLKIVAEKLQGESDKIPELVEQTRSVLKRTDDVLANLQKISADGTQISATIASETDALPGLAVQAHETLRELDRLIMGLQNHWLIRDSVPAAARRPRLSPSAAGMGPTPAPPPSTGGGGEGGGSPK